MSLFSGAMGLDLGLERAGLDISVCQDIDPIACETMKFNRSSKLKVLEGDLGEISTGDILLAAGNSRPLNADPTSLPNRELHGLFPLWTSTFESAVNRQKRHESTYPLGRAGNINSESVSHLPSRIAII
ncbi:MAG: DNA cytosine methyltransferase [Terriglobales bacterium]